MDFSDVLILLLCGVGAIALLGGFLWLIISLLRRERSDERLRPLIIKLLTHIRQSPQPIQTLDTALAALRQTTPLPRILTNLTEGTWQAPPLSPPAPVPSPNEPLKPPPAPPTPRPPRPTPGGWLTNWLAPNTTTLLLYLGAALMVIAIGVFVASGWAAFPPLGRWGMVLLIALAFWVSGELLARRSQTLRQAGETFRGLGTILLPFVALAYERFVLNGQAPPIFWVVAGLGLAGLHYTFYRFTHPGRLNAYLSGLSLGVFALMVPRLFATEEVWQGLGLLVFAAALFSVAWRFAPDGRGLLSGFLRATNHPLAESYLVIAILAVLGSWGPASDGSSFASSVYYGLLSALLVGLSRWFRAWPLVSLAVLTGGLAAITGATWWQPRLDDLGLAGVLIAWAWVLFLVAPVSARFLDHGRLHLSLGALAWGAGAMLLAHLGEVSAGQVVVAILFTGLVTLSAWRFSWPIALVGAWVVLHITLLDGLRWLATGPASLTIPTLIWLTLVGVWLVGEWRQTPAWAAWFWRSAFILETVWTLAFANVVELNAGAGGRVWSGGVSEPIMAVAATLLTLAWVWLARRRRSSAAVAVSLLLGLYAIAAIAYTLKWPGALYAALVFGVGIVCLIVENRAPPYVRRVLVIAGFGVTLLACVTGQLAEWLIRLPSSEVLSLVATSQWLLFGNVIVYAWQTRQRRLPALAYTTVGLGYILTFWLAWDYLPGAAFPLVAVLLGVAAQVLAPFAPGSSRRDIDLIGMATLVIAPLSGGIGLFSRQPEAWLGLSQLRASQVALLLAAAILGGRGIAQRSRELVALSGGLIYVLYAWFLSVDVKTSELQAYSIPLAALVFAFQWLFPQARLALEITSALILLIPALSDSIAHPSFLYTLVLGVWGLTLIVAGITLGRRSLLSLGIVGLVIASLRQLWELISTLPPGVIIAVVALLLMGSAIWLILNRTRFMPAPKEKQE